MSGSLKLLLSTNLVATHVCVCIYVCVHACVAVCVVHMHPAIINYTHTISCINQLNMHNNLPVSVFNTWHQY